MKLKLDCCETQLKMKLTSILLRRPKSSEVLSAYLKQCNQPPWTSYFVKVSWLEGFIIEQLRNSNLQMIDSKNDLHGNTSFNFTLDTGDNYHILRTWCFPYMKFHCTKAPIRNLATENNFYEIIKVLNLGIPLVLYGFAAIYLIKHEEVVYVPETKSEVTIYFLIPEDKGSQF